MADSGAGKATSRSKVERMIDEYGLDDAGDKLEERWIRTDDRWSLRELAEWFNKRLLERAAVNAGMRVVEGEVDNLYRLLTDEGASSGARIQARRRLERSDLDPDEIEDHFVSYQAIRTYLQKYRGAERREDDAISREKVRERVQKLAGRTTSVTESQLTQLHNARKLALGEPIRTVVDVQVYCEGCDSQYDVNALLDRGGCDCEPETE